MADVAHGDLALLDAADVVGEGVARNYELVSVEDGVLVGALETLGLQVLISRLLYLRHSS
jgi:hypothetical protein